MRSMEQIFRSNPAMQANITPYISRFQNFIFNTITMADTAVHPLTSISYSCEFMMVVARANNAGTVNLWNNTQAALGANTGNLLNAGDAFILEIDNVGWDFAEALIMVVKQILPQYGQVQNSMARNSLNTSTWSVVASAATQIVDVAIGLGPAQ